MNKMDFSELIGQHVDLSVEDERKVEEEQQEENKEQQEENEEQKQKVEKEQIAVPVADAAKGKLTKAEEHRSGGVHSDTYKDYIRSGGTLVAILVMLFHILSQGTNIVSFWWLTYWIAHPGSDHLNIGIYAMLVGYD
jgi:uncharacterized membrane protein YdbT with pleckstrin-like domain